MANGAEAVRSLETIPYNLVLMDVQMPELDGLQATRRIRDPRSAVEDHGVPIVAMTANALQGDRDQCHEAGMNDYITKPVSARALEEALKRWLPLNGATTPRPGHSRLEAATPSAPTAASTAQTVPNAAQPPVFDRAGLLDRLMGDEELALILSDEFLADVPKQIEALRRFLDTGDAVGALRQVHSIKGASANVGGEALRAVALETEKAGQVGGPDAIIARVPDIESQFDRLKEAMRDFAGQKEPGPGVPT